MLEAYQHIFHVAKHAEKYTDKKLFYQEKTCHRPFIADVHLRLRIAFQVVSVVRQHFKILVREFFEILAGE